MNKIKWIKDASARGWEFRFTFAIWENFWQCREENTVFSGTSLVHLGDEGMVARAELGFLREHRLEENIQHYDRNLLLSPLLLPVPAELPSARKGARKGFLFMARA